MSDSNAPTMQPPEAWLSLAVQQHRQGRTAEALQAAAEAAKSGGRWRLEAAVLSGECLFRAGRIPDLGQLLEAHADLCEDPRLKTLQARWMSRSGEVEAALALFRRLMALPEAHSLYRLCAFECVGLLNRQGRPQEAWTLAEEAHRRTTRPFDIRLMEHALDVSLDWAQRGGLRRMIHASRPAQLTAFILGMPRSGTTLLEQMLDRHPLMHAVGETPMIPHLSDALANAGGGWPHSVFEVSPAILDQWQARYRDEVRSSFSIPKNAWSLDKTVFPMLQPLIIGSVFPKSKVIRIVRDSRDNATSLFLSNFDPTWGWTGSLESIRRVISAERRAVATLLDAVGIEHITVCYETLVENPENEIRRVLDFIDVGWHAECLEPEKNLRTVMTLSHEQVRRPINRGSIGRWQTYAERFTGNWPA
jgi:hypothetical protein